MQIWRKLYHHHLHLAGRKTGGSGWSFGFGTLYILPSFDDCGKANKWVCKAKHAAIVHLSVLSVERTTERRLMMMMLTNNKTVYNSISGPFHCQPAVVLCPLLFLTLSSKFTKLNIWLNGQSTSRKIIIKRCDEDLEYSYLSRWSGPCESGAPIF